MRVRWSFKRQDWYGLTALQLKGPDHDIEVRVISRLGKRERRAMIRSFLAQIRPWLHLFTESAMDHSRDGWIRDRRNGSRAIRAFEGAPVTSRGGRLGYEIRMKRLELGKSQAQLATELGMDRSHLSEIERGRHSPNSQTRRELMRVLGIDCD